MNGRGDTRPPRNPDRAHAEGIARMTLDQVRVSAVGRIVSPNHFRQINPAVPNTTKYP